MASAKWYYKAGSYIKIESENASTIKTKEINQNAWSRQYAGEYQNTPEAQMEWDRLTDRESDLLESFDKQFVQIGRLSDRQFEILNEIFDRANAR